MSLRSGSALVVSVAPFGERDALVRLLCPERGLLSGLVKGGRTKAAVLQPFNGVGYEHYRRLEGQLGTLTLEMRQSRAANWLGGGQGSYVVAYLSELLAAALPEEHVYEGLAERVEGLVDGKAGWREVVAFELFLLDVVGYGLRLEDVVEGEGEVAYVSPTSGRSVTRGAAKGWESRLLALPAFLGGPACGEVDDFVRAWGLTGSFLNRALHGKVLAARGRLADHLVKQVEKNDEAIEIAA